MYLSCAYVVSIIMCSLCLHNCPSSFQNFSEFCHYSVLSFSHDVSIMCQNLTHLVQSFPHHLSIIFLSRIRHVSFGTPYLSNIFPACFCHWSTIVSLMRLEIAHHISVMFPSVFDYLLSMSVSILCPSLSIVASRPTICSSCFHRVSISSVISYHK